MTEPNVSNRPTSTKIPLTYIDNDGGDPTCVASTSALYTELEPE